ncbi:MAG: hypothetical protein CML87_04850 [Rhodobiaceae bacterium]|jgi:hypothetical protein|nr:hypothetical protein [Rhodobiaceae bacterium]|tara:strand:- start:599 stop:2008 length:1410 start_codon:yes stop_codon:yes gene_type:complete
MKFSKIKKLLICLTITVLGLTTFNAKAGDEWIDNWKSFAAETGLPEHAAWVAAIDNAEVRALARDWEDFRGYTASSLLAKESHPAELKPGFIITKENIDSLPWVKDYLSQFWIDRLTSDWLPIKGIRVVPTTHYYMQRGRLDATKTLGPDPFTINEKGELRDKNGEHGFLSEAGLPFTNPQNGEELNWLFNAHGVGSDDLFFDTIDMAACSGTNVLERIYKANIFWRRMAGRVSAPPLGNVEGFEGITEAGALLIKSPRDVRGLAGVRLRFADADRDDDFKLYIPSLKRTRQLTGTNGQDPIAPGLELTWDEWRSNWFKTDRRKFKYTLIKEASILHSPEVGNVYDPYRIAEDACNLSGIVDMELRPVWVYEITDLTETYQYSVKRVHVDKETYYAQYLEMFDRNGEIWRVWDDTRDWEPTTGRFMWRSAVIANDRDKRATVITVDSAWEKLDTMTNAIFNIDQLRDRR